MKTHEFRATQQRYSGISPETCAITRARAGKTFYTSLISLMQCVSGKHASHVQNIIDRLFIV